MLVKIIEFLPVIIFFVSYKMTSNLILATTLIVGSCVVATIAEAIITKKLSRMQVFLVFAVLIFGVPTILLKDPSIIKWKVTVVNMILATAIFFFQFILKKNPFELLLGKELPLPDKAFATLSVYWMVFFFFSGMLNIVIAFYLPDLFGITKEYAEELWVDYKTFGNSIINVIFALFTGFVLIKKYPELLKNDNNLNNKNVRKAINMLMNKEEYAKVLLNGNATAAVGPFPKSTAYGANITDNSSYNREEAIRILTEEGYSDTNDDGILDKDGEKLTLKLVTYSARAELPTIAQALQADLKEAGIGVSIEIAENISDILSSGSFDLCLYSNVTSSTGDPLSYLNNAMRSNGELNYGNYSNLEVDMLLDKMQLEFDIQERNALAEEIVQKVLEDDGYNFIAHLKVSFLMKNNVVGFKAHPTDYYQFNKDTYIQ